jgi:GLPGLI family protein
MKKIYFSLCIILTVVLPKVQSQTLATEGVITFEEKNDLHRFITDPQMRAMVPQFRTQPMELYFTETESYYKILEEDEDPMAGGGGGGGFRVMMGRMTPEVHINYETSIKLEQREMMGKKYLIEDTLKTRPWKLTGETKKIHGYDCMKATLTDTMRMGGMRMSMSRSGPGGGNRDTSSISRRVDTARAQNIEAWFTDAIPVAAGPGIYNSLPGMVLEVDINKGESTFIAKKVELKKVKSTDIKAPTKGEKITQAEFRKKMEEMMKNSPMMRQQRN